MAEIAESRISPGHAVNAADEGLRSSALELLDRRRRDRLLPPLVLGVGDGRGFGSSLSPAKLAMVGGLDDDVAGFELRIHGVGGSSPDQLLEQPETVQVGGDQTAQFVRRWLRTGTNTSTVPWPVEGYWWGGLTSRSWTRALWVPLIPLMLCNVASWMNPIARPAPKERGVNDGAKPDPEAPSPLRRKPRTRQGAAAACLPPVIRLAGYALTMLLAASLVTASTDVMGWQCAGTSAVPEGRKHPVGCLSAWLGPLHDVGPGLRLVLFTLVPILVLAGIGLAGYRTVRAYERWRLPEHLAQAGGPEPGAVPSWPLTGDGFWHGLRPVRRQQLLHLAGTAALLAYYLAVLPSSHPDLSDGAWIGSLVLMVLPLVVLACPQAGRSGVNPHSPRQSAVTVGPFDQLCRVMLGISASVLAGLLILRIWWQPHAPAARLPQQRVGLMPGDSVIWWALTVVMGALVAGAFLFTALALTVPSGRGQRQDRAFAGGLLGPLTLGLACATAGIFASGLNLLLPSLLIGREFRNTAPALAGSRPVRYPLVLPVPVYGYMTGLLFLTGIVVLLVILGGIWFWTRAWQISRVNTLERIYPPPGKKRLHGHHTKRQRWSIAIAWTEAEIADHAGKVITALGFGGIAGVLAFDIFSRRPQVYWVTTLSHAGQWLGLIVLAALYGLTRQAFTSGGTRRTVGVLWDVGTFWPRASQPFAPPCYMERSVPETVNRLRRAIGDEERAFEAPKENRRRSRRSAPQETPPSDPATDDFEETYIRDVLDKDGRFAREILKDQEWVLINGYSQGSPIAAAIIAQLPQDLRNKVLLMTVGSPLRRLYGRAFPAYFGREHLLELARWLAKETRDTASPPHPGADADPSDDEVLKKTRWRNIRRPSDYIGSFVFSDPMPQLDLRQQCRDGTGEEQEAPKHHAATVDVLVLDPPRLIPKPATTPPPIHRHSDFWPDPQVAVVTTGLLIKTLTARGLDAPWAPGSSSANTPAGMSTNLSGQSTGQPIDVNKWLPLITARVAAFSRSTGTVTVRRASL